MLEEFLKWLFAIMKPSNRRFTIGEPTEEESAVTESTASSNVLTPIIVVDDHTIEVAKQAAPENNSEISYCANCNNNNDVGFRRNSSQINLSATQKADLALLSPAQAQRTIK